MITGNQHPIPMFSGDVSNLRGRAGAWSDSLFVDHAVFRVLWDNFAEVIPGRLYRSNHPTPGRLATAKRRYGIKTLINLRGHRRCGLAAGLAILFEGGTAAQARAQLSWRFGHFSRSRTGILDSFFHLYEHQAEGRIPFLEWVEHEYDESALRTVFKASGLSSFLNDTLLQRE